MAEVYAEYPCDLSYAQRLMTKGVDKAVLSMPVNHLSNAIRKAALVESHLV